MGKKQFVILPLLYGEAAHLLAEGIHEVTHGLWEHIAVGCIVEKLVYYTGVQEAHMIATAADYLAPVGFVMGAAYIGFRVILRARPTIRVNSNTD